jgi:hypothetical protein
VDDFLNAPAHDPGHQPFLRYVLVMTTKKAAESPLAFAAYRCLADGVAIWRG